MKKLEKVVSVLMIVLMLTFIASNLLLAYNPDSISIKTDTTGASKVSETGGKIVGIIQVAGSAAAIAVLVILGVKYMMGSAEEKAEYKKTLIPYVIGAVFVFAASNIAKAIYDASKNGI